MLHLRTLAANLGWAALCASLGACRPTQRVDASGPRTLSPRSTDEAGLAEGGLRETDDAEAPRPLDAGSGIAPTVVPYPDYLLRHRAGLESLRRRGRRVVTLDPSDAHRGRGRFPAGWAQVDAVLLRVGDDWRGPFEDDLVTGTTFRWRSRGTDGGVMVVVTDEQIYVRTGHDNPHANRLYWLAPSTPERAAAIAALVAGRSPAFLADCQASRPAEASSAGGRECTFRAAQAERANDRSDHLPVTTKNVQALLALLNRMLPKGVAPFATPGANDLVAGAVISAFGEELDDWLH